MKTKDCTIKTRQLLSFLEAPAQHPAIEAHLETCPSCREKLARLSLAVLSERTDRLTCGQCQAELPDYAQAQMEGRDATRLFPQVWDHLTLCPHCQRLHQELLEMSTLIPTGALPEQATYEPPDLSFLKRLQAPEGFGEIVRRGAYWAQNCARALVLDVGTWLRSSGRPYYPALAAQRQKEPEFTDVIYQISLGPESLEALDVEVTVYRQPEKRQVARVVVHVRAPDRLLAGFAGSQVRITAGETTRMAQTDDDGRVVFEDVSLKDLKEATFEIIPS